MIDRTYQLRPTWTYPLAPDAVAVATVLEAVAVAAEAVVVEVRDVDVDVDVDVVLVLVLLGVETRSQILPHRWYWRHTR
jgi:hypothetical protein